MEEQRGPGGSTDTNSGRSETERIVERTRRIEEVVRVTESTTFEEQARGGNPGLAREIWDLIRYNKKWWLIPVIIVLLAIGVLVIMGSGVAATFIYPLF